LNTSDRNTAHLSHTRTHSSEQPTSKYAVHVILVLSGSVDTIQG